MIYIAIFERIYDHIPNLNNEQIDVLNQIKYIFYHYLFENTTKRINIVELKNSLTKLNSLF